MNGFVGWVCVVLVLIFWLGGLDGSYIGKGFLFFFIVSFNGEGRYLLEYLEMIDDMWKEKYFFFFLIGENIVKYYYLGNLCRGSIRICIIFIVYF